MAVTSVMLAAAKRRFPHAELIFVGPRKNYELLAGDPRVHQGPSAHQAGFHGHNESGPWQPIVRELTSGLAKDHDLGMRGRVVR